MWAVAAFLKGRVEAELQHSANKRVPDRRLTTGALARYLFWVSVALQGIEGAQVGPRRWGPPWRDRHWRRAPSRLGGGQSPPSFISYDI